MAGTSGHPVVQSIDGRALVRTAATKTEQQILDRAAQSRLRRGLKYRTMIAVGVAVLVLLEAQVVDEVEAPVLDLDRLDRPVQDRAGLPSPRWARESRHVNACLAGIGYPRGTPTHHLRLLDAEPHRDRVGRDDAAAVREHNDLTDGLLLGNPDWTWRRSSGRSMTTCATAQPPPSERDRIAVHGSSTLTGKLNDVWIQLIVAQLQRSLVHLPQTQRH